MHPLMAGLAHYLQPGWWGIEVGGRRDRGASGLRHIHQWRVKVPWESQHHCAVEARSRRRGRRRV